MAEERIWCPLRGVKVPVAECVGSCPAPEQRVVCAMEFNPLPPKRLAPDKVGGGTLAPRKGAHL